MAQGEASPEMKRLALVNRYFHRWLVERLKLDHQGDMEMTQAGPPFIDMSLEHRADDLLDMNNSYILTEPAWTELHKAVKEGNVESIVNVIKFRNDYIRLYPDEIGHVRASIDEHVPGELRYLLI